MTVETLKTEYPSINRSDTAPHKCDTLTLIPALPVFIIALAGLVGNAVVLWLLGFRMKRNSFSVYILNLAGADFLFLCCQIIYSLKTFMHFHSIFISIPKFFLTVSIFTYIAGLSFLSAISTKRCLSVLWPIWYHYHRSRHMSAVMCVLLWALSLLLSILEGKYCGFLFGNRDKYWCQVFDFITAAWLIFLFVFLSGSGLALLTRLLCGSQQVQLTRLYVTIMLTVLAFLLCGLPFGLKWFLWYWIQDHCSKFSYFFKRIVMILSALNSSVNPFIYFLVGSFRQQWQLRQTLKLVLQRALEDKIEVKKSGGSLSQ